MPKQTIVGKAVWEVYVNHIYVGGSARATTTILITTNWNSGISVAIKKAEHFIEKHTADYPDAVIRGTNKKGIIDA